LTLFSRKCTSGFAIREITQPIIRGIKKLSSLGNNKNIKRATMITNKKLIIILKYRVPFDSLMLSSLTPQACL
jgi:hypothetical protein